jgi:hypothetical protein
MPTEASVAVHQSIYRHYVFYQVFYDKKRVLYVILEYRTFVCFKSHSAADDTEKEAPRFILCMQGIDIHFGGQFSFMHSFIRFRQRSSL